MATQRAKSEEIVDVRPVEGARTQALVKTDDLEVLRLVVPRDKTIDTHQVPGDSTIHCLAGRAALFTPDRELELSEGQLVYLQGGTPHGVRGIDDAHLLVTICLQPKDRG